MSEVMWPPCCRSMGGRSSVVVQRVLASTGKTDSWSATLKDRVFYVFSSNAAPLRARYRLLAICDYATLEHSGDFTAAASCPAS